MKQNGYVCLAVIPGRTIRSANLSLFHPRRFPKIGVHWHSFRLYGGYAATFALICSITRCMLEVFEEQFISLTEKIEEKRKESSVI